MMTTQHDFIGRVAAALGNAGATERRRATVFSARPGRRNGEILKRTRTRTDVDRMMLLKELIVQGKPLNLRVISKKDPSDTAAAIAALVEERSPEWEGPKSVAAWRHPLLDSLDLPAILARQKVPVYLPRQTNGTPESMDERSRFRSRVQTAFIGITSADYCLAQTATLVMKTVPGRDRSVSLLPSIHVAVIELNQIIRNLPELYACLKYDGKPPDWGFSNCLTLISGPSKTADIELTMVHGAHGPRELYLYVITPRSGPRDRMISIQ
jgi:L-lactate dehydrogenase complex protein LldG